MHEVSGPMFPHRTISPKGGRRVHARDAFIESIAVNSHARPDPDYWRRTQQNR
jgi:hypothetical protein